MWPFSVEKGKPGPVEGRHRQFKLATNNSISHHEHVLYRFKLGYEPINRALDFGRNLPRTYLKCKRAYCVLSIGAKIRMITSRNETERGVHHMQTSAYSTGTNVDTSIPSSGITRQTQRY
jgi:hypothetical protein